MLGFRHAVGFSDCQVVSPGLPAEAASSAAILKNNGQEEHYSEMS